MYTCTNHHRAPQREEVGTVWLRSLQRQDKEEAMRKVLQMAVDVKKNRGREKWWDLLKENVAWYYMTTDMPEESRFWNVSIRAGTLLSLEANMGRGENTSSQVYLLNPPFQQFHFPIECEIKEHWFDETLLYPIRDLLNTIWSPCHPNIVIWLLQAMIYMHTNIWSHMHHDCCSLRRVKHD